MNKDEITMSKEAYYEALNAAQESGKRMGYAKGRDETAREILQEVVNAWNTGNLNQRELAYICTKYGIELGGLI
jgi:hypothetical protein